MKLQPYIQSSVMHMTNQKLSYKYFGPFEVLERIGIVAYKLHSPDHSAIHPVIHVSQLKLEVGFKGSASADLPSNSLQYRVPLRILSHCMVTRGNTPIPQVLIQWSQLPEQLLTWEDQQALQQFFPDAPAWGQAEFKGGNVSSSVLTSPSPSNIDTDPRRSSRRKQPSTRTSGPMWHQREGKRGKGGKI
jgi:hypothetical protein